MAVPTKFGAVRGRNGNAFVSQNVGGAVMGIVGATGSVLSASLAVYDAIAPTPLTSLTKQRAYGPGSGLVSTAKPISGAVYGYGNNVPAGSYIISRITTAIAGVSSNLLLFMGQGNMIRPISSFRHDFGVKMLNSWLTTSFAWTGKLASGASKNSRLMWLNAAQTAVVTPVALNTVFMKDIALNSTSAIANDNAATPSRTVPGEFILQVDFVTRPILSGGNKFTYKPITGM